MNQSLTGVDESQLGTIIDQPDRYCSYQLGGPSGSIDLMLYLCFQSIDRDDATAPLPGDQQLVSGTSLNVATRFDGRRDLDRIKSIGLEAEKPGSFKWNLHHGDLSAVRPGKEVQGTRFPIGLESGRDIALQWPLEQLIGASLLIPAMEADQRVLFPGRGDGEQCRDLFSLEQ